MDQEKDAYRQHEEAEKIERKEAPRENFVTYKEQNWFIQTRNVIYYILGVIEVLLAFRLLFLLLGANPANGFVAWLYSLTSALVAPFRGIFGTFVTRDAISRYVFDPASIIAMIVYTVIAVGLVRLARLRTVGKEI